MKAIIPEAIETYIDRHSTPESAALAELNRETNLKVLMPQMLSGHVQGKFLQFISQMIRPLHILEIGTFTGYSAICLAKGLRDEGKLITIDINGELTAMANKYITAEGLEHKIELRVGNALEIIPALDIEFDLVFIDADKINYINYFNMVIDKLKPGGWILTDNVLWSGKIVEGNMDKDTAAIDAYNQKIHDDNRVENVIVSIRDGVSIARKIG